MVDNIEVFLKKKSFLDKINLIDFREPKIILQYIQNMYNNPSKFFLISNQIADKQLILLSTIKYEII